MHSVASCDESLHWEMFVNVLERVSTENQMH